jgi:uncharacterized protein (TIGR03000 family)
VPRAPIVPRRLGKLFASIEPGFASSLTKMRQSSHLVSYPDDPNKETHSEAGTRRKVMLPQAPSLLRPVVRTIAVLILSLSAAQSIQAQAPSKESILENIREESPIVPESTITRDTSTSPTGGISTTQPVWTPGYFEVVCPAICYGGAFHVCGRKAFGGPGYYGPLRRYWAYSTYGPNFNIGPDNSLQYGLIGGVIYEAQRACHGLYKHGGDCACHCVLCPKGGGSLAAGYGPVAQLSLLSGASQQPTENRSQQTPNPARQPAEKLPQPAPNSARLQLIVPEYAEVLVEGSKTATTGRVREFVTPPLTPGKNMVYSILVRYTDAGGKKVEETHSIRVHANDQLDIDCTHQPAAQARAK